MDCLTWSACGYIATVSICSQLRVKDYPTWILAEKTANSTLPLPPRFFLHTVLKVSLWSTLIVGACAEICTKVCSFGQVCVARVRLGVRMGDFGLAFGA